MQRIPVLDVGALFGAPGRARDEADAAILRGAGENGFLTVTGLPGDVALGAATRRALLQVFALEDEELRKLWRRKFAPQNRNVYRGWFPLQPGNLTSKEGIDLGADVAHGVQVIDPADPLCERTPIRGS